MGSVFWCGDSSSQQFQGDVSAKVSELPLYLTVFFAYVVTVVNALVSLGHVIKLWRCHDPDVYSIMCKVCFSIISYSGFTTPVVKTGKM